MPPLTLLHQQGSSAVQTACHCCREHVHSRAGRSPMQQQQPWKICSALSLEARPPSSWKPSSPSRWPCRLRNWKSGEWIQKGECWSSSLGISVASKELSRMCCVHHEQAWRLGNRSWWQLKAHDCSGAGEVCTVMQLKPKPMLTTSRHAC